MSTVQKLEEAYKLARSAASGYSNYCDETPNTRRLEKELDLAETLYNGYLSADNTPTGTIEVNSAGALTLFNEIGTHINSDLWSPDLTALMFILHKVAEDRGVNYVS